MALPEIECAAFEQPFHTQHERNGQADHAEKQRCRADACPADGLRPWQGGLHTCRPIVILAEFVLSGYGLQSGNMAAVPEQHSENNEKASRKLNREVEQSRQACRADDRIHDSDGMGDVGKVAVDHASGNQSGIFDFAFSITGYQHAVGSPIGAESRGHGHADDFGKPCRPGQSSHAAGQGHIPSPPLDDSAKKRGKSHYGEEPSEHCESGEQPRRIRTTGALRRGHPPDGGAIHFRCRFPDGRKRRGGILSGDHDAGGGHPVRCGHMQREPACGA